MEKSYIRYMAADKRMSQLINKIMELYDSSSCSLGDFFDALTMTEANLISVWFDEEDSKNLATLLHNKLIRFIGECREERGELKPGRCRFFNPTYGCRKDMSSCVADWSMDCALKDPRSKGVCPYFETKDNDRR
jgi:hypothetical protein